MPSGQDEPWWLAISRSASIMRLRQSTALIPGYAVHAPAMKRTGAVVSAAGNDMRVPDLQQNGHRREQREVNPARRFFFVDATHFASQQRDNALRPTAAYFGCVGRHLAVARRQHRSMQIFPERERAHRVVESRLDHLSNARVLEAGGIEHAIDVGDYFLGVKLMSGEEEGRTDPAD